MKTVQIMEGTIPSPTILSATFTSRTSETGRMICTTLQTRPGRGFQQPLIRQILQDFTLLLPLIATMTFTSLTVTTRVTMFTMPPFKDTRQGLSLVRPLLEQPVALRHRFRADSVSTQERVRSVERPQLMVGIQRTISRRHLPQAYQRAANSRFG